MRDQCRVRQPSHAAPSDEPRVCERSQCDRTADAAEGEWEELAQTIGIAKHLLRTCDIRDENAKHETRGDAVAERCTLREYKPQGPAEAPAAGAGCQRRLRLRQAQEGPDQRC